MKDHDEEFEKYLSEFQPRRPRALPEPAVYRQVWPLRIAAAAAIAVSLVASLWFGRKKEESRAGELAARRTIEIQKTESTPQTLALLPLTQLALEEPKQLDTELERASRRVLPRFSSKGEHTAGACKGIDRRETEDD